MFFYICVFWGRLVQYSTFCVLATIAWAAIVKSRLAISKMLGLKIRWTKYWMYGSSETSIQVLFEALKFRKGRSGKSFTSQQDQHFSMRQELTELFHSFRASEISQLYTALKRRLTELCGSKIVKCSVGTRDVLFSHHTLDFPATVTRPNILQF